MEITPELIMESLHKVDLATHPYLFYCASNVYQLLKKDLPEFDEKYFFDNPLLEDNKVVVVDRAAMEKDCPVIFGYKM